MIWLIIVIIATMALVIWHGTDRSRRYLSASAALFGLWLLCLVCAFISLLWMLSAALFGHTRAWSIAKGFDLVGNATLGNWVDEYISSMATKAAYRRRVWWAVLLCRMLETVDPGHCAATLVVDRGEQLTDAEIDAIKGGWKP